MNNQHISSYENGDRPRAIETQRGDSRIHHPHYSQKASARGKSVQWKPKSYDNRTSISPNSPSPSHHESTDTHIASNPTSTSRNSSSDLGFQSHDSNSAHMAANLGLQAHLPPHSPLYNESKDNCMAENRASTSQDYSSDLGFRSSLLHESNVDRHSIGGCQIEESSDLSSKNSEEHTGLFFDICPTRNTHIFKPKPSLFVRNREIRNENKHKLDNSKHIVLRRGMVLLKRYLTSEEQMKIIHRCRQIGKNKGGFYDPGYKDGAKLKLKMMCLGRNWEPERGYISERSFDGANPPEIPHEFLQIVQNAVQKSQQLVGLKKLDIPSMIPDICIVNFYSSEGKLGLHQDKSESKESISKGLPVVSFSVGDSGDFLYGDGPDEKNAEKIVLESGDVLVFGGESRLVFHGVSAIHKKSAPGSLSEKTNIISGRLNLTFRKY